MKDLDQFKAAAIAMSDDGGAFRFRHAPTNAELGVIASTGGGWDHVSVSLKRRCPNWQEMEFIKRMFFEDHETAMQLHVPPADHVNNHNYTLHMWRPHGVEIPRPDSIMV